jgi:hypothetical protein
VQRGGGINEILYVFKNMLNSHSKFGESLQEITDSSGESLKIKYDNLGKYDDPDAEEDKYDNSGHKMRSSLNFGIDDNEFIKYLVKVGNKASKKASVQKTSNLDEILGNKPELDKKFYRKDGKLYYEEKEYPEKINPDECGGAENNCREFLRCLDTGNVENITQCLDRIKKDKKPIYESLRETLKTKPPAGEILKKIFASFRVGYHDDMKKGKSVKVLQSKGEWFNSLRPNEQEALKQTPLLKEYIESLITLTNKNLALLNTNYIEKDSDKPPESKFSKMRFASRRAENTDRPLFPVYMSGGARMIFDQFDAGIGTNISFTRTGGMSGGDRTSCVNAYEKMYTKLKQQLGRKGIQMDKGQEEKLESEIKSHKEDSKKLEKVLRLMQILADNARIMGVNLSPDNMSYKVSELDPNSIHTALRAYYMKAKNYGSTVDNRLQNLSQSLEKLLNGLFARTNVGNFGNFSNFGNVGNLGNLANEQRMERASVKYF